MINTGLGEFIILISGVLLMLWDQKRKRRNKNGENSNQS